VTGKPVWPIEERPVPKSTVPGEETWPTQPFPTKPPPIDRQGISEDDLIDFTPQLHKEAVEIAKHFVMGPLFTPPTIIDQPPGNQGTLALPSDWGAANWNTGAFDPETGFYYAVSMSLPTVYGLRRNPNTDSLMLYGEGPPPRPAGAERPQRPPDEEPELTVHGLPLIKPPYGRITAYDMNQGTKLWMVPNGDGPRNHPLLKDLNLPPLGNTGRPVALLTKTLLFLGDSSNAVMGRAGIAGPAKLRAYDKTTGTQVAEIEMPVGATGGPMTYMADGKQYIVVPVGGKAYGAGWVALGLGGAAIFTEAQAAHGQTLYRSNCTACHGGDLPGEHAPPLRGNPFWSQWEHETVRSLYSRIISTMPPDDPGSLAEKDVIDLVAYLLQSNGVPSGSRAIANANELNSVRIQRPK